MSKTKTILTPTTESLAHAPRHGQSRVGALAGLTLLLLLPACGGGSSSKPDASTAKSDAAAGAGPETTPGADAPAADAVEALRGDAAQDSVTAMDAGTVDAAVLDAALRDAGPGGDARSDLSGSALDGPRTGDAVETGAMDTAAMDTATVDTAAVEVAAPFCASRGNSADGGVLQELCYDFTDPASAGDFVPEAGTWVIANGAYQGTGPTAQVTCPNGNGSLMTASVLRNLSAQDVRVHVKMTSIDAPDKVLVLRSRAGGNRIELNFRANFVDDTGVAQGGELYIDGLVDCANPTYVGLGVVPVPHAIGQAIVADVQLVGQHLTAAVDGKTVYDDTLSQLPVAPGSVGFAVFQEGTAQFDDFVVDVLK